MKVLFGFGVLLAGYTLLYYGATNLAHLEVGMLDLVYPSRIPALAAKLSAGSTAAAPGSQAAPATPTPTPSGGRGAGTVNGTTVLA